MIYISMRLLPPTLPECEYRLMTPVLSLHFIHANNIDPPLSSTTFACDPFEMIDPSASHAPPLPYIANTG